MASLSVEDKLQFLLQTLATATEFKPDYGAVARRLGINTKANAQRRLKGIVEADKTFVLHSTNNSAKIVEIGEPTENSKPDGDRDEDNEGDTAPATSKQVKTPGSQRKRVRKEVNNKDAEGTPSKKAKTSKATKLVEDNLEGD